MLGKDPESNQQLLSLGTSHRRACMQAERLTKRHRFVPLLRPANARKSLLSH